MDSFDFQHERRDDSNRENPQRRSSGVSDELVGLYEPLNRLRPVPDLPSWKARERHTRKMLSRALDLGTTVAFVGAGCSAALGYPDWANLVEEIRKHADLPVFARSANPGTLKTEELLHILGLCKEGLEEREKGQFTRIVRDIFAKVPVKATQDSNPYDALVRLNLHRFVTANYDCELEKALGRKERIKDEDAIKKFGLAQDHPERLAKVPLSSLSSQEPVVLHCHGWLRDEESLVLTETDYRRWYLAEDQPNVVEFRQTLEILFGSNPILFVGFGMNDDDLMRVLRTIVANEPGIPRRPLFALRSWDGDEISDADIFKFDLLCARYGINVLTYKNEGDDHGLTKELARIGEDLRDHRNRWLCKPRIRENDFDHEGGIAYFHCCPSLSPAEELTFPSVDAAAKTWIQKLGDRGTRPRVLGVIGPGGSGKSTFALKLIKHLYRREGSFQRFFFWSSYYANDIVTGIDLALSFLSTHARAADVQDGREIPGFQDAGRATRLMKQLEEIPCLLVFDGIERLLRPGKLPGEGVANSAAAQTFLQKIADVPGDSTVVFTSRVWPSELDEEKDSVGRLEIGPCLLKDASQNLPKDVLKRDEDFASVVSLLDGHLQGIVLAIKSVLRENKKNMPATKVAEHFDRLLYDLSRRRPDECVFRMLSWILQDLKEDPDGRTAYELLRNLSVFMEPIPLQIIERCLALIEENGHVGDAQVSRMTEELRERGLLVPVSRGLVLMNPVDETKSRGGSLTSEAAGEEKAVGQASSVSNVSDAYAVHPIVREYVFRRIHHGKSIWPNLGLAGATAATATVDPGNADGVKVVKGLFDILCEAAEDAPHDSGVPFARYAFSVLRSRMTAITVPRWGTYSEYLKLLIRIADLARNYSGQWRHAYKDNVTSFYHDRNAILRAEELAWLYNEIGLAHYLQGSIADALGIWQQGYEINRLVDSDESVGEYVFQSNCNLGAANIQYGRLGVATEYLRAAKEINCRLGDEPDHGGRIEGYLGLIEHLKGNLNQAETLYVAAVDRLVDAGNLRGQSMFLGHLADLHMKKGKLKEASECIQTSRALAQASEYPELVREARLSEGHLFRSEPDYAEATRAYMEVLEFARKQELRSLEADALSELSRLALDLGDYHSAKYRAIKALHIANELVLGLRQTHGLVVLGLANVHTGQRRLGCAYLEQASSLAEKQGYLLRKEEADKALYSLGLRDAERKSA
ncbi:MAG TPA: SIR2 family protein [Candidatus Dormibacteraeota bacterium]|nr:SIR2 family protein [Candidatus Dormibacteraeota bacterium]